MAGKKVMKHPITMNPLSTIEKDTASPFAISRIPCNQPRCRNTAAACAGGKCWTCQAKAHRV